MTHAEFGLPQAFSATEIAVESELGDSVDVPQSADVATLSIVYADGRVQKHEFRAGRDTAEFAYDRADVRPLVKHARAIVFSSQSGGHTYVTRVSLDAYRPVARVAIDWHYATAALTLENMSLVDARKGIARAFGPLASLYAHPDHWVPISIDPSVMAFRNEAVRPHAWIARPMRLDMPAIEQAIHTGEFPSGSAFRPDRNALVSEDVAAADDPSPADRIRIDETGDAEAEATASCAKKCFAVFRDAFDSANWTADIDGISTPTYATDIALRAVEIPAGTHRVRFRLLPLPLYAGSIVTGFSLLFVIALLTFRKRTTSTRV